MNIVTAKAEFGVSYNVGWTLFLAGDSFISDEIKYFTRRDRGDNPAVSHAATIIGDDLTLEAFGDGVHKGTLSAYLADPKLVLYVRCPLGWTPDLGARIAAKALTMDGRGYDYIEIVAMLVANDEAGHLLNEVTKGHFDQWVEGLGANPEREICSREAVIAMTQPEYLGKGSVAEPPFVVTPQSLIGDDSIYEAGATKLTA